MLLFVYGSLMKDLYNHTFLETSTYLGKYKTVNKYVLSIDSDYPYLSNKKRIYQIEGELYEVSNKTLDMIDYLEDEGRWYYRKSIKIYNDKFIYNAQAYFNDNDGIELPTGNLKKYIFIDNT